jgi:hypothetical protein
MFSLIKTLSTRFSPPPVSAQERRQKHLSQATGMHELQARIRHLDGGHRSIYRSGPHSVFMA